ncbi:MAG: NUDIX domain-containing protein [Candidatus Paceibacterota bacterium]|jgi:8-oxo-dGTP diphosphatase
MKQTVSSILISTDNEFILQQRDDKSDIARPGMITNFGGSVEKGEKPINAIIREIQEELSIKLSRQDFQSLGSSIRKSSLDNKEHLTHLFVARNIKKQELILQEGREIVYVGLNKSLDSLNLSPGVKEVLMMFKNEHSRWVAE